MNKHTTQKKLLLSIVAMFWFAQYVYVPYQTPYLLSLHMTAMTVGIIIGAYGFSQFLLRMPVGILADKKGRHKGFILVGIAASGIASLFRIFLPNDSGFLIGNLLSGLASAMWISFMVLYSNYFAKEDLQKSMGKIIAANNLGILGGFVASTFFYETYGMEFLCAMSAAITIPALLLALVIKEPVTIAESLPVRELILVYKDKRLILFSLLALAQQGIIMSTSMSFTAEAAKRIGATPDEIGICSIVYIIAAVLSSYFAATSFAQKWGASFWIPSVFFCLALYCFLIPNITSIKAMFSAQILAGMSTGILCSYCTSEALRDVPITKKSTAMGYYQSIYAIGMTVMPVITGKIAEAFGLMAAFYIESLAGLIGSIAALVFYYYTKKYKFQKYENSSQESHDYHP